MNDWWVDGHFISAETKSEARATAAHLFDYKPQEVRPWTEADNDN